MYWNKLKKHHKKQLNLNNKKKKKTKKIDFIKNFYIRQY